MNKTSFVIFGVVLGIAVLAGGVFWYQNSFVQLSSETGSGVQTQMLEQMARESDNVVFVNTEESNQDLESIEQAFDEQESASANTQTGSNASVDAEIQSLESDLNGSVDQDMESNTSDLEQLL